MARRSNSLRDSGVIASTWMSSRLTIRRFSGRVTPCMAPMMAVVLVRWRTLRSASPLAIASGSGSLWSRIRTRSASLKYRWYCCTRARVQQYQRYFSDADRVLILLHNDPDPDAMASGLALRNVLHRTKTTAIIGAVQGVTRPENLRMLNLLDIHVEAVTPESVKEYSRVAMVDVQPHYFGGLIDRADLVIDPHPEQPGNTAVFKDIRPDYGSTCTILTEHLRAVDVNISERAATAMLYAIKSDTLFFNRQTNNVDIEAFSYLYPLADAALIRKMEGSEITVERLEYVLKAYRDSTLADQVFCAFLGPSSRE